MDAKITPSDRRCTIPGRKLGGFLVKTLTVSKHCYTSQKPCMPINGKYTPYEKKRVENAIQYIHNHFTEDISADGLALEVCIDIKHLQKIIKKITGYTVHHYLLKVRIE